MGQACFDPLVSWVLLPAFVVGKACPPLVDSVCVPILHLFGCGGIFMDVVLHGSIFFVFQCWLCPRPASHFLPSHPHHVRMVVVVCDCLVPGSLFLQPYNDASFQWFTCLGGCAILSISTCTGTCCHSSTIGWAVCVGHVVTVVLFAKHCSPDCSCTFVYEPETI
jgi:hypothetical protein